MTLLCLLFLNWTSSITSKMNFEPVCLIFLIVKANAKLTTGYFDVFTDDGNK